jgi:hypothetical protein
MLTGAVIFCPSSYLPAVCRTSVTAARKAPLSRYGHAASVRLQQFLSKLDWRRVTRKGLHGRFVEVREHARRKDD